MVDHYCVAGSLGDAISMFSLSSSPVLSSIVSAFNLNANDQIGLKGACQNINATASSALVGLDMKKLQTVCAACQTSTHIDFSDLYGWWWSTQSQLKTERKWTM
ncbi:hypothetical protein SDRG_16816 [Saprolegnia diclina VS20]|uniref:Uncharacterized protein n=1 Tax=Saprolegnia diclina (strain VS20) TaxID=1156394 RepID=T0PWA2_SAPDV|nr:hypothetical protein SDRG_16816 [Saprolegnia diclina VS20]EQC25320.1 hypothetical protein SDRG_16816 [Saprolegnia diclina VS20]|eukprot:XP_008621258.1 hypothetical protein SDRG_16816 [Saprolegnia diclina VS20]